MHNDCILNMSLALTRELDLKSASVTQFATALMQNTALDKKDRDRGDGSIVLFQEGKQRRPREVELKKSRVTAAGGVEIVPADRVEFLKIVADLSEQLDFSKLDLEYVDMKFIFRVTHWGNHNELLARVFWPSGPLFECVNDLAPSPLYGAEWSLKLCPTKDDNIILVITPFARTGAAEIRSGKYDGDDISLAFGLARTGALMKFRKLSEIIQELVNIWDKEIEPKVVPRMLEPLAVMAKGTSA